MAFVPRLFRFLEAALLRQKRFLMDQPEDFSKMDNATAEMYLAGSVNTLRDQFQQMSQKEDVTRQEVDAKFTERIGAIETLWNEFIESHKGNVYRKNNLTTGRDRIVDSLRTLQADVMGQLDSLLGSDTNGILSKHTVKYKEFLKVLRTKKLLRTEPAPQSVAPTPQPAPPARPESVHRPASRLQPPERVAETPPPSDISMVPDLLRRDRPASQPDTPILQEENGEVFKKSYALAVLWKSDIPSDFSRGFFDRVLYRPNKRIMVFMKKSLDHPDQLKQLVKSMHDVFHKMYPHVSASATYQWQLTDFFENAGIDRFTVPTMQGAMNRLQRSFEWSQSVEELNETPTLLEARELFFLP